ALEPLYELGNVLRLIGEIGLHHDESVAARITCTAGNFTNELVQREAIASALLALQNRQWNHFGVGLERLASPISASIVIDDDLVLARIVLKDAANAPKKHTDGLALVVSRNTDVDQFDTPLLWVLTGGTGSSAR